MRAITRRRDREAAKLPRRRRRLNFWKAARWTVVLAPWCVIGGVAAAGAWIVWSGGGGNSFAERAKSEVLLASLRMGFEIEEVWVDGLNRADRARVLKAIGAVRGEPILEFDPAAARKRLMALGWVKDARVQRSLPRRIYVALVERQPLALWQQDGRLTVIDQSGAEIRGVEPARFGHLPILVGKGADDEAAALLELVRQEPAIADRLTAAVFVAERRWDIRIDDRIDVRLPAEGPQKALARLVDLEKEHGLFGKDIVAIDLRLEDRLIVKLAPGAVLDGGRRS